MTGIPAVVSAPFELREFVTGIFGVPPVDIISGGGRIYLIVLVNNPETDLSFSDPIDGVLLVECSIFNDLPAARAWVALDIQIRNAKTKGAQ